MPAKNEFVEFLIEQLAPMGPVSGRAMFGGWGLYFEGRMFCLVADDVAYFKADGENKQIFEIAGCCPFVYEGKGKSVAMSYYQPPADAVDDSEELCRWARLGVEAAARAAVRTPKSARKTGKTKSEERKR